MPVLTGAKRYIYQEQVKYKAGVSEAVGTILGQAINFINDKQHSEKQYFLNGPYANRGAQNGVDGLTIFNFNAEIFNVYLFNLVVGTSGTTELDLKLATNPAGAFTSIFTTTPKVTSSASANVWIGVGETVTGMTAPVLTAGAALINAGDALRLDLISAMPGAQNCGLVVHYRPR